MDEEGPYIEKYEKPISVEPKEATEETMATAETENTDTEDIQTDGAFSVVTK